MLSVHGKSLCPTIEKAEPFRSCAAGRRTRNRKASNLKMIPAGKVLEGSSLKPSSTPKGGDNLVVTKENTDKRKPAGAVINRT